jgi:hypothetical protein
MRPINFNIEGYNKMNDFIHVDCNLTRAVLEGRDISSRAIMQAAYYSDTCQSEDYKSQHISDCVYSAREKAVADMWQALNGGNETAAVDAMRKFWSV